MNQPPAGTLTPPVTPPGSPSLKPTVPLSNLYTPPPSPGLPASTLVSRPVTPIALTPPASPTSSPNTPLTTTSTTVSQAAGANAATSTVAATTSTNKSVLSSITSKLSSVISSTVSWVESVYERFKDKMTRLYGWVIPIPPTDAEKKAKGELTKREEEEEEKRRMNATVQYSADEALRKQSLLERWKTYLLGEIDNLRGRVPEEDKKASEARNEIFAKTVE